MLGYKIKILFISLLSFVFILGLSTQDAKAALSVPISCDSLGAACASESTIGGYTANWTLNYGGNNSLSTIISNLANSGSAVISAIASALQTYMESQGGNTIARSFLSTTIMPKLMDVAVKNMLGTGGNNKAGNIVQNWLDYTSNARIGGGQNFTKTYYSDPSYLNMPEPMRKLLENNLDARYGKYGSDKGIEYKDVARYNYDSSNKSGSANPFEMSDSSDLLWLLQPQNNYLGSHVLATNYQDLAADRTEQAGINEPLSNKGALNTKDKNGNVIPGSLSQDVYQQQIIQTINGAQNVKSLADAESFITQMIGSAIQGYLEQKFNEDIGKKPSDTSNHIFGQYSGATNPRPSPGPTPQS